MIREKIENLQLLQVNEVLCNYSFLLFIWFLPLYEAPKNIFGAIFLVSGAMRLYGGWSLSKEISRSHLVFGGLMILTISPFFSGLGSEDLHPRELFFNSLNWSMMPMIALIFLLNRYPPRFKDIVLKVFCCSLAFSILLAFYEWEGAYPELHSVGHVNQSALYVAFASVFVVLATFRYEENRFWFLIVCFTVGLIACYLMASLSFVALGMFGAVAIFFWLKIVAHRKISLGLKVAAAAVVVIGSLVLTTKFDVHESGSKFLSAFDYLTTTEGQAFSKRDALLRSSIEIANDSAFGFGVKSYSKVVTVDNLKAQLARRGVSWDEVKSNFFVSNHGHGLFSTVIVERGWFGVVSFVVALVLFGIYALTARDKEVRSCGSYIGLACFLMIAGGLGQTTLHNEHGQLALLAIAYFANID